MTIVEAIKAFAKKQFNVDLNGQTTSEVMSDMNDKVEVSSGGSGGGGVTVVKATFEYRGSNQPYITLTSTWQEVYDAAKNGLVLLIWGDEQDGHKQALSAILNNIIADEENNAYSVGMMGFNTTLATTTSDGYPTNKPSDSSDSGDSTIS